MEGLGINLGYLLVQIFNFAVLFVVIYAWAVKPIVKMLEKRRESIARGLEDARVAEEARTNAEAEAQKIIAESQVKAASVVREATERAETAALEVRSEADAEIEKLRASSLVEIAQERERDLSALRGQVGMLAVAAAQKLIGESLIQDEASQRALLDEFFSGVKSGKVVVLDGENLGGSSALVTSALPLTEEEQTTIRRDLLKSLDKDAEVVFKVDPNILGGLVVQVGDRVIDGSVSGQLDGLRQSIQ